MYNKIKIFCIKSSTINLFTLFKINLFVRLYKNYKIAFDMQCVNEIKEDFLNFLKKQSFLKKISLVNLNSDIMTILNIKNYDKFVYIYADENDFKQNSRTIVNRNFKVINVNKC